MNVIRENSAGVGRQSRLSRQSQEDKNNLSIPGHGAVYCTMAILLTTPQRDKPF